MFNRHAEGPFDTVAFSKATAHQEVMELHQFVAIFLVFMYS